MFECKYCGKSYRRESTLSAHLCEKKRRRQQEKEIGVQNGYRAYLRFFQLTQPGQEKNKTYQNFMDSNLYLAFVKFGRHIKMIRALKPDRFIDFVIKENKKIDWWCRDSVYTEYLNKTLRHENPQDSILRGLTTMIEWGDLQNDPHQDYFKYCNSNLICNEITKGNISPWVVYNCDSGQEFLSKLNEDQLNLIYKYIDPEYWQPKFKNYIVDTEYVKDTLREIGL